MFKKLKGKAIANDQGKTLKISHATMMKKEERKVVFKKRKGFNINRYHPLTLKRSSSKSQHKEKGDKRDQDQV